MTAQHADVGYSPVPRITNWTTSAL